VATLVSGFSNLRETETDRQQPDRAARHAGRGCVPAPRRAASPVVPERLRSMVGSYHDAPLPVITGNHQRLVKARRFVALLPTQPVGFRCRKEQQDDPAHRTPPPPTPRPRRRERGPAQAASARDRCRAPATARTAQQ